MFRGYLAGGFWGLVVSTLGLGTASLVAEQPAGNEPPATPTVVSPDAGISGDTTSVDGVVPDGEGDAGGAPQPSITPGVSEPEVVDGGIDAETAPSDQPDGGEISAGLAAPETPELPDVSVGVEEPVLPNPQGIVPVVPDGEADIVLETTTPEPPVETEVIIVEDPQDTAPEVEEVVVIDDLPEAPEVDVAEAIAGIFAQAEPETPEVETTAETELEADALSGDVDATPQDTPVEVVETAPTEPADTELAQDSTPEAATPTDGPETPTMVAPEVNSTLPVTPSTDDDDGPLIALQGESGGSLPGQGSSSFIGGDDETPQEEAPQAPEDPAPEMAGDDALTAFATPFDVTGDAPLMSVILIDDGSLVGGEAALAEIPFPVTIALDPTLPDAQDKMLAYREAGFEVLAMIDVPEGALATDAEVAFQAGFSTLPEVIGLLDLGQAGLQGNTALADQAMARLSGSGMGYVAQSQGLNGGLRAAEAADVPARTIYRDLDSEDQDAVVIRRFLDQAAFRARQQGSVLLVGRVRPDTISALILWTTGGGTSEVDMAPASAALTAN